ncbi:putative peptide transporter ptr2 [Elsinoe australis]|uniref:Putative peptide transporter ptr2 n=1 Tax=Elsinoe australis TaxID=40998 RepID=A0A4U7B575_9PEZI|nr:putative peptide transporter ptr2 [Elsinoe australis]
MPVTGTEEASVIAQAEVPPKPFAADEKDVTSDTSSEIHGDVTKEDLQTLRRVSGKLTWMAYTIAFVELCERFSYYGTTVVFVNFIQQDLPLGSTTGAAGDGQPGALGLGQRASTGLTTFNQFWAYVMPLIGAWIADAKLGRYKTIHIAIAIAIFGHVILTASAAPSVIAKPNTSIGVFAFGLIIFGVGTGFFKANIAPLVAEQQTDNVMRVETLKSGERVLVDPAITTSRLYLYFYLCINVGSLTGQIAMVYAEKYVGFWLSFMLPTVLFCIAPIVLLVCKKKYILTPPTGSVLSKFFTMFGYTMKGKWSLNVAKMKREFTWDVARPSHHAPGQRPNWMTYDDAWVDEVRRGLKACKVFLFLPLYWLAYGQMTANLTSQAAVMRLNGVPNDIIQNLNPISIVIMIPIFDFVIYPALRKAGIRFTPLKRMATGFFFASLAMVAACVIQVYVYRMSPCGNQAATCEDEEGNTRFADINVWVQTLPYVFIGISEIFTSIVGLEYAFSKAPTNMRSLVLSINYLMNAFSSALAQALVALSADPLLVWNYGVVAVLAFLGGCGFWYCFRGLDKDEDKWNMLQTTQFLGKKPAVVQDTKEVGEPAPEAHQKI